MTETALMTVEEMLADKMQVFCAGGMEPVLQWVREQALELIPDVETAAGRKAIASNAHSVARAKTTIDGAGKQLVADWKRQAKEVDDVRKHVRETLDALKEEVRAPLTQWEKEEEARLAAEVLKREIERAEEDAHQLNRLYDLEKAEEKRLAEEAARKAAEAKKAEEERIRREAEEKAKREAEEAVKRAEREKAEAEARERKVRGRSRLAQFRMPNEHTWEELADMDQTCFDRIASVDREQYEAKLEREAKERAEKKAQEEAERRERQKEEDLRRAKEEAERKEAARKAEAERKAANTRHRNHVNGQAAESLIEAMQWDCEGDLERAMEVVRAIAEGRVKHVTIQY